MYTDKVIDHFKHPRNLGALAEPTVVGQAGNPICGDVMKLYLKVKPAENTSDPKQAVIEKVGFETLGCAAAIAVTSSLTEIVKGKTLAEARTITKDDIVKYLGGLPAPKIHCSMLGVEALQEAINQYIKGQVKN